MPVLRAVSWNIARRTAAYNALDGADFDIALLQETVLPTDSWERDVCDRGADVKSLSTKATINKFTNVQPRRDIAPHEFTTSAAGTIAVAQVYPEFGEPFIAVSIYARWESPHSTTPTNWRVGYSDAMAHRAISDLSAFIGNENPASHRILIAGDFNLIYGASDTNRNALPKRDQSVFERLEALGFEFLGPQFPNGRQAVPVPSGLHPDTLNVPTFHTTRQNPCTAQNQLDYVFASRGFHETISVRALNRPREWGPSDHCRIAIDIELT